MCCFSFLLTWRATASNGVANKQTKQKRKKRKEKKNNRKVSATGHLWFTICNTNNQAWTPPSSPLTWGFNFHSPAATCDWCSRISISIPPVITLLTPASWTLALAMVASPLPPTSFLKMNCKGSEKERRKKNKESKKKEEKIHMYAETVSLSPWETQSAPVTAA